MAHRTHNLRAASSPRTRSRLLAAAVSTCFAASSYALPTAPSVANGNASFNQVGNVLNVTNSNGAIINWNTFSIGASETTRFIQTSASSSVLNRVLSANPSVLLGTLTSNGRVFLINPNGIMVGQGAQINVSGFVASTLNLSDANFLANKLKFDATPNAGSVVNQGAITTPSGGSVYLVAPNVSNQGLITTPQGETILAAGQTVTLLDTGTPGVGVEITGAEGNATNLGSIVADAGRIGIAGVLVKNSGMLNASSVVNDGGRVFLKASQDAYVDGDGRIITTGSKGGNVEVLGNRVAVMDNASIDVSGANGGGTVLVGGDYQGKNAAVQNSTVTYFGPDASIKADATSNGNGGKVVVWADDTTRAYGSITARGGADGGNGGFVETSGHDYLDAGGVRVNAGASLGAGGTWLLDPSDITIVHGGTGAAPETDGIFNTNSTTGSIYDSDVNATLNAGTNLIIETRGSGLGLGTITANGVTIQATTNTANLSLLAYGGGSATGDIQIADSIIDVRGSLTMVAGWNGASTSAPVVTPTYGTLDIHGEGSSTYVHSGGAMILKAGGDINLLGGYSRNDDTSVTVRSIGNMTVNAGGVLTVQGAHGYSSNSSAVLASEASQTITAQQINVYGGNTDISRDCSSCGYSGGFASISSMGSQTITANNVYVIGGGNSNYADYDNFASIQHGYTDSGGSHGSGDQTINITNGGAFVIQGGFGRGTGGTFYGGSGGIGIPSTVSNNYASVWNDTGTNQIVTFANGGELQITGGGVPGNGGSNNFADLGSKGNQTIGSATGRPDIAVFGGYGGKLLGAYSATNDASISADGTLSTQTIFGSGLNMHGQGDSATYGGAFIGGGSSIAIDITGNVYLHGGYSNAIDVNNGNFGSPVAIGNEGDTSVTMHVGGYFDIFGGQGVSSGVLIGSLTGNATVNITAAEKSDNGIYINNYNSYGGVVIGSLGGNATVNLTAGANGYGGAINIDNYYSSSDVLIGSANGTAAVNLTTHVPSYGSYGGNIDIYDYYSYGGRIAIGALNTAPQPLVAGDIFIGQGATLTASNNIYIDTGHNALIDGQLLANQSAPAYTSVDPYGGTIFNGWYGGFVDIYAGECSPCTYGGGDIHLGAQSVVAGREVWMYTRSNYDSSDNLTGGNIIQAAGGLIKSTGGYIGVRGDVSIYLGGTAVLGNTAEGTLTGAQNEFSAISNGNITVANLAIYNSSFTGPGSAWVGIDSYGGDVSLTSNGGINLGYSSGGMTLASSSSSGYCYNCITGNNVNINAGSLSLAYGGYIFAHGSYGLSGMSGGNVNIVTTGAVSLQGGGYIESASALSGKVSITAGGMVSLDSSSIAGGEGVLIGATGVSLDHGSMIQTGYLPTSNVEMVISGGDLTLNNGSSIIAGNDVILTLTGANAQVVLNDIAGQEPSYILTDVATQVPETATVNFTSRTTDGIVIDGATTTTTAVGGSGFFVVDTSTPATTDPGGGLVINYAQAQGVNPATNLIDQFFSDLASSTFNSDLDQNGKKKDKQTSNEGNDNGKQKNQVGQCT